jgi:serine/threonine protein kinase
MVGRYRIHALLGIGGMGRVYLGWAQNPGFGPSRDGAWVAVKVIRPDLADNTEFRRRFARELETVGRVRSPYAAALVQGDAEAQQPWMVTEFVPGVALADAVKGGRPLPAASVWRLAHDLGSALVAVHQAGIVHRDVKPSNVILNTGGAKIIDFGVAHASDLSQLTATGMNIGTPSYMAPEQAKTGDVSPASDMFSLGVLLYFAATGKLPFGEGGTAEVLFRVVYEEPDLSGLDEVELPAELRDVVLRCMAKDPLQRPNAAGAVAMAQAAAANGAWSPHDAAQWPEALAAQIHERTLAAGRTLPDPSLAEEPRVANSPHLPEPPYPNQAYVIPPPPILPPSDSEPTVFTGSAGGRPEGENESRKRNGVLVATISTIAVLALGVTGYLVLRPSSDPSANVSSTQSAGNATGTASMTASESALSIGAASAAASGASGSASQSTSSATASASSISTSVSAVQQQTTSTTAATTTSAAATGSSTSAAPGTPNKYTAAEACGSGFSVIDSHAITGATIYLLYNSSSKYNCVATLATTVYGKVPMSATLAVEGGTSGSDSGNYTYYAGPVKESAPSQCVKWGGSYNGGASWTSGWSHCG